MKLNVVFSEFSDENHVRNLVRHVKRENAKFKNRDVISRVYVQMATRFNYESLVHVILEMVGLEPEEALYNELMTVYDDITDIQFDMMFCGLNMGKWKMVRGCIRLFTLSTTSPKNNKKRSSLKYAKR